MNTIHILVTYVVLQRVFGHIATTVFYEISKHFLFTIWSGLCLTGTMSYNYLKNNNKQKECVGFDDMESDEYISDAESFDSEDFYIDSEEEEEYLKICKKK